MNDSSVKASQAKGMLLFVNQLTLLEVHAAQEEFLTANLVQGVWTKRNYNNSISLIFPKGQKIILSIFTNEMKINHKKRFKRSGRVGQGIHHSS